jgi:hypothetical protein
MIFNKVVFHSHKKHNPTCDIVCGYIGDTLCITYGVYMIGDKHEFMETYSGRNYIVGSKTRSYSRVWHLPGQTIPKKWAEDWEYLKSVYEKQYKGE